ncbi:hypothetical protein ABMX48_29450 [Streptomyces cavourensis]|uniref:hypothetical protein n=1 Tax=Streptomyces TaxID=1883 RepID=UPI00200FFFE5|nr:hypothetical protein [Streptomyces sp. HNA39]UQA34811.1 hypothetical protein KRR37_14470 [Streptomyces sp. HNA39]
MARIQILELPMVTTGDTTETPFILLVDQATEEEAEYLRRQVDGVAEKCGARAAIIASMPIDVA